jgi:hypothetical protein
MVAGQKIPEEFKKLFADILGDNPDEKVTD